MSDSVLDSHIKPREAGDPFLLYSDGLYRSVGEEEMTRILNRSDDQQAAADETDVQGATHSRAPTALLPLDYLPKRHR